MSNSSTLAKRQKAKNTTKKAATAWTGSQGAIKQPAVSQYKAHPYAQIYNQPDLFSEGWCYVCKVLQRPDRQVFSPSSFYFKKTPVSHLYWRASWAVLGMIAVGSSLCLTANTSFLLQVKI